MTDPTPTDPPAKRPADGPDAPSGDQPLPIGQLTYADHVRAMRLRDRAAELLRAAEASHPRAISSQHERGTPPPLGPRRKASADDSEGAPKAGNE